MKVYQVREKIGGLFHVYAEFKLQKDARKFMGRLIDRSNFDITTAVIK